MEKKKREILDGVVGDVLSITPLVRRNIQRKLVRTAFARIEHNISLPHLEIMLLLRHSGKQHIAGIGEALQIPKPQMTHLIDRLESLKLIVRRADRADRRVVNIALTARGRRIIDELDQVIRNGIGEKLSGLSQAELKELSVSLRKLGDIFSKL
jgi:MarR family transcriptional regulator, organic hydroperoxide resistance regulator